MAKFRGHYLTIPIHWTQKVTCTWPKSEHFLAQTSSLSDLVFSSFLSQYSLTVAQAEQLILATCCFIHSGFAPQVRHALHCVYAACQHLTMDEAGLSVVFLCSVLSRLDCQSVHSNGEGQTRVAPQSLLSCELSGQFSSRFMVVPAANIWRDMSDAGSQAQSDRSQELYRQ